jgi:hypothetical protein
LLEVLEEELRFLEEKEVAVAEQEVTEIHIIQKLLVAVVHPKQRYQS